MLGAFLVRRFDLVLVLGVVFVVTVAVPMKKVEFVNVQEEERSGFYIGVDMPASYTLEETEQWFLEAEKVVEEKAEELGLEGWFLFHRKTHGELQGWFNRPRTTDLTPKEVTEIVLEALPERPGIELNVGEDRDTADEKGPAVYRVVLYGEDWDILEKFGNDLEDVLAQVPGVLGPKGGNTQTPNELALVVDRQRTQQYGVNPQVVAGVVGYALRGTPLPKYYAEGKEIPVRVRFQEKDRESLTELSSFQVPTASGELLPLSALTETQFLPSPRVFVRRDKRMGAVITLELKEDEEDKARQRLAAIMQAVDLPEGVTLGENRQQQNLNEDLEGMQVAGALSVVFIYLLMGFLFESFILPLSIVLTIPLSAIGVWWVHFITGYDLDFLGVVAIVLLIGVVVNNGIVLIDYVNRLRNLGKTRTEALLTATNRRFRPIMMTAITTVGGMVPLALAGANSIGLSYTSFSLTLIGGMTTATLLTLLVVPVFYTFFDDAREVLSKTLRRVLGHETAKTEPASAEAGS
jgi:HAE1 family hydrophobic/amphiphilic exporter-1